MSIISFFLLVAGVLLGIVGCQAFKRKKQGLNYCPVCTRRLIRKDIGGAVRTACPTGHWVHWNNPKPVVIVLVPLNGKLVLVKRKFAPAAGSWALPGGFIEAYEHPAEAAVREVLEETGLKITIQELLDVKFAPGGTNEILFFYLAKPASGTPVAGDDAADCQAYSKADVPQIAFTTHRQMVASWFDQADTAASLDAQYALRLSELSEKRAALSRSMAAANHAKKELSAAFNLNTPQLADCRDTANQAVQGTGLASKALDDSIAELLPLIPAMSSFPGYAAELSEAQRVRREAEQQSIELLALIAKSNPASGA